MINHEDSSSAAEGYESLSDNSKILSIAIVTHNRKEKLMNLLHSLLESPNVVSMLAKIVIVDDSPVRMEKELDIPNIIDYIWMPERIFITKAKNLAWKRTASPLILFVDDDNIVSEKSILHMVNIMNSSPGIGAVMPSVSYLNQPSRIWVYSTPFVKGKWSMILVGRNSIETDAPDYDLMETDALPNAFMIRRSVLLSISGFDENFLYNNSCDLCQRIKEQELKVYASSRARFLHDVPAPGNRGYWADHVAADAGRAFPESRDWALLMRKLHGEKSASSPSIYLHFIFWVFQVDLGMLLIGLFSRRFIQINVNFMKGFLAGLKVKISNFYCMPAP